MPATLGSTESITLPADYQLYGGIYPVPGDPDRFLVRLYDTVGGVNHPAILDYSAGDAPTVTVTTDVDATEGYPVDGFTPWGGWVDTDLFVGVTWNSGSTDREIRLHKLETDNTITSPVDAITVPVSSSDPTVMAAYEGVLHAWYYTGSGINYTLYTVPVDGSGFGSWTTVGTYDMGAHPDSDAGWGALAGYPSLRVWQIGHGGNRTALIDMEDPTTASDWWNPAVGDGTGKLNNPEWASALVPVRDDGRVFQYRYNDPRIEDPEREIWFQELTFAGTPTSLVPDYTEFHVPESVTGMPGGAVLGDYFEMYGTADGGVIVMAAVLEFIYFAIYDDSWWDQTGVVIWTGPDLESLGEPTVVDGDGVVTYYTFLGATTGDGFRMVAWDYLTEGDYDSGSATFGSQLWSAGTGGGVPTLVAEPDPVRRRFIRRKAW